MPSNPASSAIRAESPLWVSMRKAMSARLTSCRRRVVLRIKGLRTLRRHPPQPSLANVSRHGHELRHDAHRLTTATAAHAALLRRHDLVPLRPEPGDAHLDHVARLQVPRWFCAVA